MARAGGNGREKRRGSTDFRALVQSKYPGLPENQRKVADFLLQHLREAPFLSVLGIEKQSGASKATVVRLAQSLGFSGFLELRSHLLKRVQFQIRQTDIFPISPAKRGEETLTLVAHQDIRNISQTVSHLDRSVFTAVVGLIVNASHVYTAGLGISSLMARTLAYSLNQVAVKASPLVHDSETFVGQLPFIRPSDLLIAFSFPPYSRETVDLARAAAARHIRVVGITDKLTSPVSFHCAHVLPIRSQNRLFTNSFSAISVLINALATDVALRNRPKAVKALKVTERLLHETGHYVPE